MKPSGFNAKNFKQEGFKLNFEIDNQEFTMNAIGQHTVENATAAVGTNQIGVDLKNLCRKFYQKYEGIYRRHQILGTKKWSLGD